MESKPEENKRKDYKIWCSPCGKLFKDKTNIKAHNGIVHTYDIQMCEVCSREFKNKISLKHHVRIVHTIKTINCKECNKEFKNEYRLDCHMKCFHERSFDCICYVCGKKYKNDYALKRHMKKLCLNKQSKTRRHKNFATYGKVEGSKGRYCKECDRTFGTEKALRRHQRVTHEWGPRTWHLCPMTYKNNDSLRKHCLRVHRVSKEELRVLAPTPQSKVDEKNWKLQRNSEEKVSTVTFVEMIMTPTEEADTT